MNIRQVMMKREEKVKVVRWFYFILFIFLKLRYWPDPFFPLSALTYRRCVLPHWKWRASAGGLLSSAFTRPHTLYICSRSCVLVVYVGC